MKGKGMEKKPFQVYSFAHHSPALNPQ